MNISLVMVTSDGKSKDLPPMHLPIMIGRADDCKLRIPVAAVSRHHAELVEDDDELVIRDLKSSNGTFVNKERIKSRELLPGDLLSIGPAVLVVKIDGHPKAVDPIIAWANGAVAPGEGGDATRPAMAGVPTWSGTAPGGSGGAGSGGGASAGASAAKAASKPSTKLPAKPPPMPKGADDSGDLSNIIADLSESDFDIDFGDDEKPKGGAGKK